MTSMTCSPKGLIKNTSLTREEIDKLTPEEIAQLGMRWEQIGSAVLLRRTDVRQEIKNSIAYWTKFAESRVEANPATDGTLDRTAAAKAVLATLQRFKHTLAAAERNAPSRDLFYLAICYSLSLPDDVHQLAIIDNKTPIVAWRKSVDGARRGGRRRSACITSRDVEMAKEFEDSPGGRMSDTARMVKIGAARKLKRTASINAVKSGRRYLNRIATRSVTSEEEELTPEEEELIASRSVTPEEMEQLGPDAFQLRSPDEKIKNSIEFWTKFAGLHVEEKPTTDGTLDRTAAAKAVLATLQRFNHTLAVAGRNAASGDLFYLVICYSLSLADDLYQLAIIDNETPIVAWEKSVKGAGLGGRPRSGDIRMRNRRMAKEFQNRRGGRMSDTALMAKIGAAEKKKLKRRASVYAVKSGLRDLKRD